MFKSCDRFHIDDFNAVLLDGCESETVDGIEWPESDIGQVVRRPCPCEEFLQSGEKAKRICGGTYSHGGHWMVVDYTPCVALMNQVTSTLCTIVLVGYHCQYDRTWVYRFRNELCHRRTVMRVLKFDHKPS